MSRSASKLETHKRIVKVAAKGFRERGLAGISVADVMTESGGTVGGFYKHFESRDALVIEALSQALTDYDPARGGEASLSEFLAAYLSPEHRDSPGNGCATAALLGDLGRASEGVRDVVTDRFEVGLEAIQEHVIGERASDRRANALLLMSSMMGAVALSRAMSDPALSTEILRTTKKKLSALARDRATPPSAKVR